MKHYLTLSILFLSSLLTFSQSKPNLSELSSQINKLISDTNNNFRSFIGAVKKVQGDTIYFSKLNLTETFTTEIHVHKDSNFVTAYIETMVTEKEASTLLQIWKKYLKKTLPRGFKQEPFSIKTSIFNSIGYTFRRHGIEITVGYTSVRGIVFEHKKNYSASLLISNK